MPGTLTDTEPTTTPTDDEDSLDHIFCRCTPDLGLCGADLAGCDESPRDSDENMLCVVCIDLEPLPCKECGKS